MLTENKKELLFGKFEIIDCWKKDETSAVYLARHRYLDKNIVLKILNVAEVADPLSLERFKQEAKLLAQVDHPGVIKILDFGLSESFFYISFEHFAAASLRTWMTARSLTHAQKISVLNQLAQALAVVHRIGIIHRDVKPENILLSDDLVVKLADFGLAQMADARRLTDKNSVMGTPAYLAPEQIRSEPLTPATDVFAFGIVCHELFSGKNPFLGADVASTLNHILSLAEAEICSALSEDEPELQKIIATCLQRQPKKRYQNAEAVCQALTTAFQNLAHTEQPRLNAPAKSTLKNVRFIWLVIPLLALLLYALLMRPEQKTENNTTMSDTLATVLQEQPKENIKSTSVRKDDAIPKALPSGEDQAAALRPARLMIFCLPWADVFIDQKKMDTTPMSDALVLAPGTHELALQHPHFPVWRKEVQVEPGSTLTVHVRLDTLFGFLQPLIHPWGYVLIDSIPRGVTPLSRPVALEPGPHQISVQHPQYASFAETVFITAGDTLRYHIDLNKIVPHQ